MYFVYFIKSSKRKYIYVGLTENISKRLSEHNAKKVRSTMSRVPYILVYYEAYLDKTIARKRELELKKSWSEKEKIINRINLTAPSSNG